MTDPALPRLPRAVALAARPHPHNPRPQIPVTYKQMNLAPKISV
jgi:hypothetical protein